MLRYTILVLLLAILVPTWSGCGDENSIVDGEVPPPGQWIICKGETAITDTIWQQHRECLIDIPAEGGTYRIKCLVNCFVGYEIEDPKDWPDMLTVLADDRYINPLYYDITFTPNETKVTRQFTIHCYLLKSKAMSLKVIANQAPTNP